MQLSPGKSKQCDEDVTGLPIEAKTVKLECQIEVSNWTMMSTMIVKICQLKLGGQKRSQIVNHMPKSFSLEVECERVTNFVSI